MWDFVTVPCNMRYNTNSTCEYCWKLNVTVCDNSISFSPTLARLLYHCVMETVSSSHFYFFFSRCDEKKNKKERNPNADERFNNGKPDTFGTSGTDKVRTDLNAVPAALKLKHGPSCPFCYLRCHYHFSNFSTTNYLSAFSNFPTLNSSGSGFFSLTYAWDSTPRPGKPESLPAEICRWFCKQDTQMIYNSKEDSYVREGRECRQGLGRNCLSNSPVPPQSECWSVFRRSLSDLWMLQWRYKSGALIRSFWNQRRTPPKRKIHQTDSYGFLYRHF